MFVKGKKICSCKQTFAKLNPTFWAFVGLVADRVYFLTAAWRIFTAQWAEFAPFCGNLCAVGSPSALENMLGVTVAMESWCWKTALFRPISYYVFCMYSILYR